MKTLENYSSKELFIQILKNFGNSIWNSKLMFPFRRKWNSSRKFRNNFVGWTLSIIFILLVWFVIIPVMTYVTNFLNYVFCGITPLS